MAINFGDSTVQSSAGTVGDPIRKDFYRLTGKHTCSGNYANAGSATTGTNICTGAASYSSAAAAAFAPLWTPFTSYSVPTGATRIRLQLFCGSWGEENNTADYYGIGIAVRHGTTWSVARYQFFADMSQELGAELSQWSSHANDICYNYYLEADVAASNFNACKWFACNHESQNQLMTCHDVTNSTSNYPSPQETYLYVTAY